MKSSEAVVSQNVRPNRVVGLRRLGDDPEALLGVVNHGDDLGAGGCDGPVLAQKVQGVIGVEAALEVEGQMQVE